MGCSRCRFSARGCKECWERWAASAGDEWHVPDLERRDRLDEARQSKKHLLWKAAELADADGGRACQELLRKYAAGPRGLLISEHLDQEAPERQDQRTSLPGGWI